jgi:hypothetical protein
MIPFGTVVRVTLVVNKFVNGALKARKLGPDHAPFRHRPPLFLAG